MTDTTRDCADALFDRDEEIELQNTDRYKVDGAPYPDKKTRCPECEGMGHSPFYMSEFDKKAELDYNMEPFSEPYFRMYLKVEVEHSSGEGWHYLKCIECKGAGKRASD